MRCDAMHLETRTQCVLGEGQHESHTGTVPGSMPPEGVDWLNEEYVAPLKARTVTQREIHKAYLRQSVRTGRTDQAAIEARFAEQKAEWIAETKRILHTWCQQHAEPFTTPEDIWPLLTWPGEMRAMVVPVKHGLKRRWMHEVGATRLRDVYTTSDGHHFPMNKIVPIYESLIVIENFSGE